MKKQILLINTHSFIDVITNSSTELFVCNNDKTLEQVKEILEEEWEKFIKANPYMYSYDDNPKNWVKNGKFVWEVLRTRQGKTEEEKIDGCIWGYEDMVNDNTIVIEGLDDNSIPHDFFDIIENVFNAQRFHLG